MKMLVQSDLLLQQYTTLGQVTPKKQRKIKVDFLVTQMTEENPKY